ncbi:two component transcriptional regulator, LuxR family [Amycolatopsis marina]|uniref:Two component transcriptional regulator, LuxR family n=1 Tax=Amycolatopsis marina TaxID=490629 RepID=A0A1I1BBX7_9PSEU|nr:response regulator transcription factor [Amycolatopsis marina]SFB47864.1 two component transcriptional regulator, LuxR family [Amycolatopsis marina]
MIRVVLVDDEDLVRGALATLLDLEEDISVVAQGSDGEEAIELARLHQPDIVLLDLEMRVLDGLAAAEVILRELDMPVVIVTRHARHGVLKRALTLGVRAFVPKVTPASKLSAILRDVHAGGRYVDPDLAATALTANACPLSERELELLRHSLNGDTITTIAERTHLAHGTVRNYLSSAMGKLGADTRYGAARRAWEEGWI